jgi:hypothetical protein
VFLISIILFKEHNNSNYILFSPLPNEETKAQRDKGNFLG